MERRQAELAAEAKARLANAKEADSAAKEAAVRQREQAAIERRQAEIAAKAKEHLAKLNMDLFCESPMVNKRVRATGLVKSPELNGRLGFATEYDASNGRYTVEFNGPESSEQKALRPENLEVVTDADGEGHANDRKTPTNDNVDVDAKGGDCLLYTSPSPRDS